MNWDQLISTKRLGLEDYHASQTDERTEFQRDYDRIIFSSSFRRLQNKTQVFPLPQRIYVHNRLTHSLEVASVGRSLGNIVTRLLQEKGNKSDKLDELGSIVAASCLVHDIGNPPFGHSGEKVISSYFKEGKGSEIIHKFNPQEQADLLNFEGNANAFRLLTQQFAGKRPGGYVLTYSTLAATVKYPYSSEISDGKKFGFFHSEAGIYERIAHDLGIHQNTNGKYTRHPLVYLVEAADDICYQVMDVEDAFKLGILSKAETEDIYMQFFDANLHRKQIERIERTLKRVEDANEQIAFLRGAVIGLLIKECTKVFVDNEAEILNGTFPSSLIKSMQNHTVNAYETCSKLAVERIYNSTYVLEVELAGFKIINTLMEVFIDAVLAPEKAYSKHIIPFIPGQFYQKGSTDYGHVRGVIDYISGMTDLFALDMYRKITGISLQSIS